MATAFRTHVFRERSDAREEEEEESDGRRGGKGERSGKGERRLSGNATVQRPDGRTWPLIVDVQAVSLACF